MESVWWFEKRCIPSDGRGRYTWSDLGPVGGDGVTTTTCQKGVVLGLDVRNRGPS